MLKYLLSAVLLLSFQSFPQNIYLTGKVTDSNTNIALSSANILLYHLPDSSMQGTTTNKEGVFIITNVKAGNYSLIIKYLGYNTHIESFEIGNKAIDFGTIKLLTDSILLDEVDVVENVPVVVQSGDTIVYNADAFKVNKDAVAEDLLNKVPGIQVEDGKVKAHGEEVKKVYVDGKTFFGDDPNAALKNIPADIIERVQIFDQQSDQSEFTGFDDGNTSKAINIVTRLNIRQGTFGKLLAGYGTENKYNVGGNVNMFDEDQRVSIVGQLNNINEQNFQSMDLLGVMGGDGPGGGDGGMRGPGGGDMSGQGFGNGNPGSLIASENGETKSKAFGINYNNTWNDNLELGGSYFFNNTDNDLNSILTRDYITSSYSEQKYIENSLSENKNINHRVNLRLDYDVDSLNQIRFIPSFSLQKNTSQSFVTGYTTSRESRLNYSNNVNTTDLSGINLTSLLMYRHKFNSSGRTISLSLNTSYKKNDGSKKLLSESVYYDSPFSSDTLNQLSDLLNSGSAISADVVYTEPLNKNHFLMLNASHSVSYEKNDKETYNYSAFEDSYSLFDTSLSNTYNKNYITNAVGVGYHFQKDKLFFNANLSYNISTLESEQKFPESFNLNRKFYSILPSAIFRYHISRDKNFNIFYRTFNTAPSVTQLQNVLDNSNPLQLSIGNPNLAQEHSHFAAIRFSTINFRNMHSLFLVFSGTYKNNYIGNKTIIAGQDTMSVNGILLSPGSQLSTPENLDGYISLTTFATYGMPANFISSNFNLNLSASYTRTPGIINDGYNYSNVAKYGFGAVITSNISSDIDFLISSTGYYNKVRNTISKENDDDYFSESTRLRLYWLLFDCLVFQGELNHTYQGWLAETYNPNTYLLNLSLGMKVFSDNKGEIRLSVYDALNKNNNITRQSTDYYTQESSSNVIGRYFLLSFIYTLRTFS